MIMWLAVLAAAGWLAVGQVPLGMLAVLLGVGLVAGLILHLGDRGVMRAVGVMGVGCVLGMAAGVGAVPAEVAPWVTLAGGGVLVVGILAAINGWWG